MEWQYADKDLPKGAAEHLSTADPEVIEKLKKIFKKYKEVFPSELPKSVPPDRGVHDVHRIPLQPGSTPPVKKMYRTSPAEQLLIKEQIAELTEAGLIRPS